MSASGSIDGIKASETAPGVRLLRELWDIPRDKGAKEPAPSDVRTDIYNTPLGGQHIPPRSPAHH